MPLAEGAALHILAGKPDLGAFRDQRPEGQRLGKRPVDTLAGLDHLGAVVHEPLDGAVRLEALRHFRQLFAYLAQLLERHRRLAAALLILIVGSTQAGPLSVKPVGLVGLVALADVEFGFQIGAPVGLHLFEFAFGDHAFLDQPARIQCHHRLMTADLLVHGWLRERRLVALIVAEAAIAEHVDDHRLVEGHAEFGGHLGCIDNGFRIIAIDVEDRRLDHLGDIRRIGRRTRECRIGGKADLVVDDEMHCTGNTVATQARQAQHFGNHTLAGKRRITMQQQRHHLDSFAQRNDVAVKHGCQQILLGAGLAHHHRVDDFQVRRVGGQRQVHLVVIELTVR